MSVYNKVQRILDTRENFKNPEVNSALNSAKKTFLASIKKYPSQELFEKNVNLDDEIADLSVVLLSAADVFGDFEEEVEIRTLLEMIWSEGEDCNDDESSY